MASFRKRLVIVVAQVLSPASPDCAGHASLNAFLNPFALPFHPLGDES